MLPESRERGYKPGRFSFNVKGGRCEACQGDGLKRIEMNFLPDVYVTCDVCRGRRYNQRNAASEVQRLLHRRPAGRHCGRSAAAARKHPADPRQAANAARRRPRATSTWANPPPRFRAAKRSASSWRKELSKRQTGRTLYILDEPTTGLHFEDVAQAARRAAAPGGSGQYCGCDRASTGRDQDRRLDHRPGPGWRRIRRQRGRPGTPEQILRFKKSYTAQALRKALRQRDRAA